MKSVKLSLIAALVAGSFSTLNAKSLEEAIKNVDVSGFVYYRYDSGRFTANTLGKDGRVQRGYNLDAGGIAYPQTHRYRAELGTKVDAGNGFKIFGQLLYSNNNHSFKDGANYNQGADTKQPIYLKQAYLEYQNADYGYSFKWGRQNLNTIWTDDLAGMAAEAFYSPTEGFTLAAFAVDSFESGDDEANFEYILGNRLYDGTTGQPSATALDKPTAEALNKRLYKYNLYGVAILTDFAGLKTEFWGAYWQHTANLWAVKLDYTLPLGEDASYRLHANYYGNTVDNYFKKNLINADNGQLFNLKGEIKIASLDANLGGIMFGKEKKYTINTLEDAPGNDGDLYIGSEIFYQRGSWTVLSQGKNTYGYFGAGYTLPSNLRVGIKGVYGGTKIGSGSASFDANNGGGQKMEGVAEISWKYNAGLSFLTYYSYLSTKAKGGINATNKEDAKSVKNTVRFQAKYTF